MIGSLCEFLFFIMFELYFVYEFYVLIFLGGVDDNMD